MTDWPPDLGDLPLRHLNGRLEYHPSIGSTSTRARELATPGAVVLADRQTSGRGRQGRPWDSPPGVGLWFSVLLRPELPPERAGVLSIVAGVALAATVEQFDLRPAIRWPNDLQLDGRKFAGILVEARGADHVIGVGLNVSQQTDDFPPELRETATSLRLAGRAVERGPLLRAAVGQLDHWYGALLDAQHAAIEQAWVSRCAQLGQTVRLRCGDTQQEGIARRFSLFDGITLELPDGSERTFRNAFCVVE